MRRRRNYKYQKPSPRDLIARRKAREKEQREREAVIKPGTGEPSGQKTCDRCSYTVQAGELPSHDGSPQCRQPDGSKAIAAGGTRAHCTCTGCF